MKGLVVGLCLVGFLIISLDGDGTAAYIENESIVHAIKEGGKTFAQVDLEGTWHFHGINSGKNWTRWEYGTLQIHSSGTIIEGDWTTSDGISGTLAGSLSLHSDGRFTGTLTASGPGGSCEFNVLSGKMDRSKTRVLLVNASTTSCSERQASLIYLTKTSGSFQTDDLEGTWHLYYVDITRGRWTHGSLNIDSCGNVAGGSYSTSDHRYGGYTGGNLFIDKDGKVDGTIETSDTITISIEDGKMHQDKSQIVWVDTDTYNVLSDFGVGFKGGGTYASTSLAGTWYLASLCLGQCTWLNYGTLSIDSTGNVTNGTYADLHGNTEPVSGGILSLNTEGSFTGTIERKHIDVLCNDGQVDQGETSFAFIGLGVTYPRGDNDGGGHGGGGGCFIHSAFITVER